MNARVSKPLLIVTCYLFILGVFLARKSPNYTTALHALKL